jgi:predicted dehydrogenase
MSKKDIVRLAIIGTGAWSGAVANVMNRSKKVQLVTCYEVVPEKGKAFSDKYGCDYDSNYEDVLKRNDIDGVHLITPNAIHSEQTLLAAKFGKHVFVEKPIANTITDGKNMIEACDKAGVVLMVGHHLRRLAGIRKLNELIEAGAIGDPIQVEGNFSQNLGFSLTPESFRWYSDDSGCPAGSLMTMGIHHVDTYNYLFGPIKSVFSFFNKLYIPAPVDDVTATIFQFESGILGHLGSNYASPKALWIYIYGTEANMLCTVTLPNLPFEEYLLRWQDVDNDTKVHIFEKDSPSGKEIPIEIGNPILEEIDEFASCIQTGEKPETDGKGGLVALSFIRAAIESAETGCPVKLSV